MLMYYISFFRALFGTDMKMGKSASKSRLFGFLGGRGNTILLLLHASYPSVRNRFAYNWSCFVFETT